DTMLDNDLHPDLVIEMSKILAWSMDFYRIDTGDRFKVLFNEQYVGDDMVGVEQVKAIYFMHRGKEIEGYHFEKDTVSGYFAPDGENLRKMFLQAPLEFGRISSRFSHSRVHPIHGDRRPHYGTDYAAPRGTPILAVGDGLVTRRAYTRGNGYYVRIRHNAVYETQYLHLSRFADGITEGVNVSQGDVIGYVGSTGMATGPHVCFRFWENGRQVDHLRLDLPSGEPLPEAYMDEFVKIRDQYKAALDDIVFEEGPSL
ncbi:MAG: M23 family metallopeptidase, partial [Bacteroidota bacterium]